MTDASDDTGNSSRSQHPAKPWGGLWLRRVVLLLAAAESLLLISIIGLAGGSLRSSDPLARAIAEGVVTLAAIPLVLLAVPALILGAIDRWLPVALLLAALVTPLAILLFHFA